MPFLSRRGGRLPDFLIIGAQRGGTTSLYNYLVEHPQVAPAAQKEVHFFDMNFHRGTTWYRAQFAAPRRGPFGRGLVTGEASPYYLFHPHAARRVAGTLPRVRLIALLRNPVDRAFSHYKLGVAEGWEALSFEEALQHEAERLAGETERILADETYVSFAHQHFSYLARGRYVEQLPAWLDRFPRERLLILRSEDLYADASAVLGTTLRFLGLQDEPGADLAAHNVSDPVELNPAQRARLAEHFRPYNRRLFDLLGQDLGWEA